MLTRDHVKSEESLFWRTAQFTKVNGLLKRAKKMEEVFKFGQMDLDTMGSGEMVWPMDMGALFTQRVMFMRENGLKIKPTDLVFTLIIMVADMKVNGFKINNTDMALNNGQMALNMRVNTNKE